MSANPRTEASMLERAHAVLPGGTFGNTPADIIIREGRGSRVVDESGREYIDYLLGSGPMIVGHAHPEVNAAVKAQLERGTTFFANNPHGIALAEALVAAVPCADKVRYASTGTEADAYAIRLARAYRGRSKILKFEGGYHGYSDYGLMSLAPAKPGNDYRPSADSAGIPEAVREDILVAPFNDVDAVAGLVAEHGKDIAAVMMEPFQRLIPPRPGFLESMREITAENDILLVFDEVVTGFRLAYGGAQAYYGVVPDLCTLGKAIGGGLPLSAIVGREEVMALFDREQASEERFVPQIGTLSGNPVAAAAGVATLEVLARPGTYERLFDVGKRLMEGLSERLARARVEAQILGDAPMFDVVFTAAEVRNYRDIWRADKAKLAELNRLLLERGILKGDNKCYMSTVHDDEDVARTLDAWEDALAAMG